MATLLRKELKKEIFNPKGDRLFAVIEVRIGEQENERYFLCCSGNFSAYTLYSFVFIISEHCKYILGKLEGVKCEVNAIKVICMIILPNSLKFLKSRNKQFGI